MYKGMIKDIEHILLRLARVKMTPERGSFWMKKFSSQSEHKSSAESIAVSGPGQ